jgi:ribonuclease E
VAEPEAAAAAPAIAAETAAEAETSDGAPRRGWWQRTFGA